MSTARERLDRVVRFVDAYVDVVLDDDSDGAAKAACELALFARQVAFATGDRAWPAAIAGRLAPRLRSPGVLQRMLWLPSRGAMLAVGHGLVSQLGHADRGWDAIVHDLAAHPAAASREVNAYEALEERWSLGLVGAACARPVAASLLDRPLHPLFMHEGDAYAFTHTAFYLTDFGRCRLADHQRPVVADVSDAGAAWALARGDFDLAGEHVLASRFAGGPPTPMGRLAVAALFAIWDDLGFVPDAAMAGLAPGTPPPRADLFFAIYHANLVAGMVAASLVAEPDWLTAPTVPPRATWPGGEPVTSRAATPPLALAPWLEVAIGERRAESVSAHVAPGDHARCAADLAIHRGVHQRDLATVAAGLRAAVTVSPPSSSTLAARSWLGGFTAATAHLDLAGAAGLRAELADLVGR